MDATQMIYFFLSSLAVMLPQFIVIIIGIIFSIMNWSHFPKASKMALGGLGIMLFIGILGLAVTVIQIQLPLWYGAQSYTTIAYINTSVRFVLNIIWAVGLGLLIYAVWSGRNEK